jgi:choline dehydrogenase-like flavoprotein
MNFVIGSGPAGIGAALALLEKNLPVTILDSGEDLEPEKRKLVDRMAQVEPEEWYPEDIKNLKAGVLASVKGVSQKLAYGSDFPYRKPPSFEPADSSTAQLWPSFAKGGLTNVWGAALLPYHQRDMQNWPITIQELEPFYEKILSRMPMSSVEDDLLKDFPLYKKGNSSLKPSRQAKEWLEELEESKSILSKAGFTFGRSRLAITTESSVDGVGCKYCTLCMYGCPYDSIYKTSFTLDAIKQNKNLTYIQDVIVENLEEENGKVVIRARSKTGNESRSFSADRVFLGSGVVPTARIMLSSMRIFDESVFIRDSQHFILPLIRYTGTKGVSEERLFTLSQLFLGHFDESLDSHSFVYQAYTYNDFYAEALKNFLGPFYFLVKPMISLILGRLVILQGYLHSDLSGRIKLTLSRSHQNGADKLLMETVKNPSTHKVAQRQGRLFWKYRQYFKAFPLLPFNNLSQIGHGNHHGGTFPMKRDPGHLESDILGRIKGWQRVHLVDSSTFPSISPGPIALTIMANAYRISQTSVLEL